MYIVSQCLSFCDAIKGKCFFSQVFNSLKRVPFIISIFYVYPNIHRLCHQIISGFVHIFLLYYWSSSQHCTSIFRCYEINKPIPAVLAKHGKRSQFINFCRHVFTYKTSQMRWISKQLVQRLPKFVPYRSFFFQYFINWKQESEKNCMLRKKF